MFCGAFHMFCGETDFFRPNKLPFCSRQNFFTDKFGQNRGRRQPNKNKRKKKGLRPRNMPLRHRDMPPRRFDPSGLTNQPIRRRLAGRGAGRILLSDLPCELYFFKTLPFFGLAIALVSWFSGIETTQFLDIWQEKVSRLGRSLRNCQKRPLSHFSQTLEIGKLHSLENKRNENDLCCRFHRVDNLTQGRWNEPIFFPTKILDPRECLIVS